MGREIRGRDKQKEETPESEKEKGVRWIESTIGREIRGREEQKEETTVREEEEAEKTGTEMGERDERVKGRLAERGNDREQERVRESESEKGRGRGGGCGYLP